MKKVSIIKIENRTPVKKSDWVEEEFDLKIIVNGSEYRRIEYSGHQAAELCIGLLFVDGVIHHRDDIKSIKTSMQHAHLKTQSSKRKMPKPQPDYTLSAGHIYELMETFQSGSLEFLRTGGRHSVAMADGGTVGPRFSDISRHNAVFKLIGHAVLHDISLSNKTVLLSCRVTESIAKKFFSSGVAALITNAAVTEQAINLCKASGITLAGFVRGNRMNVYVDTNLIYFK
jgi:FdhD protein